MLDSIIPLSVGSAQPISNPSVLPPVPTCADGLLLWVYAVVSWLDSCTCCTPPTGTLCASIPRRCDPYYLPPWGAHWRGTYFTWINGGCPGHLVANEAFSVGGAIICTCYETGISVSNGDEFTASYDGSFPKNTVLSSAIPTGGHVYVILGFTMPASAPLVVCPGTTGAEGLCATGFQVRWVPEIAPLGSGRRVPLLISESLRSATYATLAAKVLSVGTAEALALIDTHARLLASAGCTDCVRRQSAATLRVWLQERGITCL